MLGGGTTQEARLTGAGASPAEDVPATHRAIRNAGILTISLMGTWSIALIVRLLLPRFLGPTAFGALHFADYFAQGFFLMTALGVDTYIRKEVPVRPSHASDFFGGVLVLRLSVGLLLLGAMAGVLHLTGKGQDVRVLVFLYAAAHFLLTLNQSYGALLQARGRVAGLATVNFLAKAGWGGVVVIGLIMGAPLLLVPAALIVAEAGKALALTLLSRRHLSLRIQVDRRATTLVMIASLPFFLNILAQTLYDKISVSMIGIIAGNTEAGFYGAATVLTAAALMLTPIISSVLLPHSSLAAARSSEALQGVMEGALRITFTFVLPVTFLLIAGADLWVSVLFGEEYLPCVPALQIRAASLVLTYLATLSAIHLFQLGRMWRVTTISLVALIFNPIMNYFFIGIGMRHLGAGGAGAGAATASLISEILVVVMLQVAAGRRAILLRTASRVVRCAASITLIAILFVFLSPLGAMALAVCAGAWIPVGLLLGAVDGADLKTLWTAISGRARGRA